MTRYGKKRRGNGQQAPSERLISNVYVVPDVWDRCVKTAYGGATVNGEPVACGCRMCAPWFWCKWVGPDAVVCFEHAVRRPQLLKHQLCLKHLRAAGILDTLSSATQTTVPLKETHVESEKYKASTREFETVGGIAWRQGVKNE